VRAIERASTFVFSRPALSCLTRRPRVGSTTRAGVLIDEWVEDAAGSGLGDNDPLSHSSAVESDDLRSTSRLAFAARNVRGEHSRPDRCRDVTVAARHTFPHGDASQQRTFHGVTVNDLAFGEPRVGAATAHRGLWSGKNAEDGAAETLVFAATRRTTTRARRSTQSRDAVRPLRHHESSVVRREPPSSTNARGRGPVELGARGRAAQHGRAQGLGAARARVRRGKRRLDLARRMMMMRLVFVFL